MIKVEFDDDVKKELAYLRYQHPHALVQRKAEVLWLKSQGFSNIDTQKAANVSKNTIGTYLRQYRDGGIDAVKTLKFHVPSSELDKQTTSLEAYFREHPPATAKQAMDKIEELTGLKRSPERVRAFMKRIGMKVRKVGTVPAKADPDKQEKFKTEELEPRIEEAKKNERAVFFVDAAHFVMGSFLGWIWCFARVFVQSSSGRQRFNVLAALNAITHELVMVTNDTYINAQSVCELLCKISDLGLTIPITLILDNARYQKCVIVAELAKTLNIELLYLPTYSPNLNLIERLWRFVKEDALNSTYYKTFADFKSAITTCLSQTQTKHKAALHTLLSLKFQTFQKSQFMPL